MIVSQHRFLAFCFLACAATSYEATKKDFFRFPTKKEAAAADEFAKLFDMPVRESAISKRQRLRLGRRLAGELHSLGTSFKREMALTEERSDKELDTIFVDSYQQLSETTKTNVRDSRQELEDITVESIAQKLLPTVFTQESWLGDKQEWDGTESDVEEQEDFRIARYSEGPKRSFNSHACGVCQECITSINKTTKRQRKSSKTMLMQSTQSALSTEQESFKKLNDQQLRKLATIIYEQGMCELRTTEEPFLGENQEKIKRVAGFVQQDELVAMLRLRRQELESKNASKKTVPTILRKRRKAVHLLECSATEKLHSLKSGLKGVFNEKGIIWRDELEVVG
jgi:hypothetical protein